MEDIRIAISSDSRGFPINATLIASILRRASVPVHVRCWCRGFLPKSFQQGPLRVEFLPATDEVAGCFPDYVGRAVFDRLRVIREAPDWDRCLIMDYDQVAFCDLAPLFAMDLGDRLLAARMQGPGVDLAYAMREWLKCPIPQGWEHAAGNPYFSMGPLLNLAEMRKAGTWERLLAAQEAFRADENLALVAATQGRTMDFDRKWNLFVPSDVGIPELPEGVVHWLGWPKPWHESAKVWRPELWEAERCSWEHLRMGLWDKPVAVEVEPDDDHGVEELLRRGWKVRLFTGWRGAAEEEMPTFKYPDLEVRVAEGEESPGEFRATAGGDEVRSGRPSPALERVRFGPGVKASEWLAGCRELPEHAILRGPVTAEEVGQVAALGYGEVRALRHYQWPAGGPMPRVLAFSPLEEIRALDATEEWYLRRCPELGGGRSLNGPADGGSREKAARNGPSSLSPAGRSGETSLPSGISGWFPAKDGETGGLRAGILVAALGKDRRHLRFFLEGLREKFLQGVERRVFVFTDGGPVPGDDVTTIRVEPTGPENTDLARYGWVARAERDLADCDLLFLFKPQARVVERIGWEEVATEGLVSCLHSAYEGEPRAEIRFEENDASVAWVAPGEGRRYACGSWQGGSRERYLEAVRTMAEWIGQDRAAGVEPYWGAESYWNRYLIDVPPELVLDARYAWRTGTKAPRSGPPKLLVQHADEGMPKEKKPGRGAVRKGVPSVRP